MRHVTLGFIVARGGTACDPAWGGFDEYPGSGPGAYRLAQVRAFRRAGGDVVPSFGGQAGTELAAVCDSVPALVEAYRSVIDTYEATHVDFDIEGSVLSDAAANTRRSRAIAELQRGAKAAGRSLKVSYTLPVTPKGLGRDGLALVRDAVANGVSVDVVNVMAMDYGAGAAPNPKGKMGRYAIQAGTAAHRQLTSVFAGTPTAALWRKVGVTVMIGINDVVTERTGLRDARMLVKWARRKHIGSLGMWALGRDRQCARPTRETRNNCSSVKQKPWAFSRALGAFRG